MEMPDVTQIQRRAAAGGSTLLLAIIASPASDLVKCFAIGSVALVACALLIADALIRRGRASVLEAKEYTRKSDDEGA